MSMDRLLHAYAVDPEKTNKSFNLPLPRKCPICSVAYCDVPLTSYYIKPTVFCSNNETNVYALYFCPNCEHIFLVCYQVTEDISVHVHNHDGDGGHITHIYPTPKCLTDFTEHIKALSPRFIEIYHQSEKAEGIGLTEICGMGYRKSLEFLIKDYAVHCDPDKSSEIQSSKTLLSQCINNYIKSEKIKILAKASSWIGNDETHYSRKHTAYNLQDLKRFITTTVAYINYELNCDDAAALLSNPK
ncbi:MAG: hypothetical protein ACOX85_02970 [Candidatus Pararuminococcus gallinarum]|jgi:hypothetical protein